MDIFDDNMVIETKCPGCQSTGYTPNRPGAYVGSKLLMHCPYCGHSTYQEIIRKSYPVLLGLGAVPADEVFPIPD